MSTETQDVKQLIYDYIVLNYRDDRGIHIETVLSALGAFAGYGCQAGIREGLIKTGKMTEEEAFIIIKTTDGEIFYYGDFLNEPLLSTEEGRVSVFALTAGAALHAGAKELPDIEDIAANSAKNVGYESFGVPRLPPQHMPKELPIEALQTHWEELRKLLEAFSPEPLFWGWEFATIAQKFIVDGKAVLDPAIAVKIVMEAAIPMSKVNLKTQG